MKYAIRLAMIFVAGLWGLTVPEAFAGPGGHGGGGHGSGHGGGGHSSHGSSGGHASSGHASGHTVAHSVGSSIFHFFGGHGRSAGSQPSAPAAGSGLVEQKAGLRPNSLFVHSFPNTFRPVYRRAGRAFVFGQPFVCPRRRGHGGFFGCPPFANGYSCFSGGGFFFDPFFFGLSSMSWYGWPTWSGGAVDSMPGPVPAPETGEAVADNTKREPPVTLLQLRDGSMYGLTVYWVEGENLHYFTTYGGEDSVPLQRIDFDKTVQLNADRGVEFVLRPKPASKP